MELEFSGDGPEELKEVFETLKGIKENIYTLIVAQLQKGECNYLSNDSYGYPYDYKLYSRDSLDPIVRSLNTLLEKVEETFKEIKIGSGIK